MSKRDWFSEIFISALEDERVKKRLKDDGNLSSFDLPENLKKYILNIDKGDHNSYKIFEDKREIDIVFKELGKISLDDLDSVAGGVAYSFGGVYRNSDGSYSTSSELSVGGGCSNCSFEMVTLSDGRQVARFSVREET